MDERGYGVLKFLNYSFKKIDVYEKEFQNLTMLTEIFFLSLSISK